MGEEIQVDERGRITLPKSLREKYGINPGDQLIIDDDKGILTLKYPAHEKIKKIITNRKWKTEAFLKTGSSTFED